VIPRPFAHSPNSGGWCDSCDFVRAPERFPPHTVTTLPPPPPLALRSLPLAFRWTRCVHRRYLGCFERTQQQHWFETSMTFELHHAPRQNARLLARVYGPPPSPPTYLNGQRCLTAGAGPGPPPTGVTPYGSGRWTTLHQTFARLPTHYGAFYYNTHAPRTLGCFSTRAHLARLRTWT